MAGLTAAFFIQPISSHQDLPLREKTIFLVFFIAAMLCMGFSFTFHTLMCHSRTVNSFYNKLDYVGISVLCVGTYAPWTYYGFYCRPTPRAVYLATIVLLCLATIVTLADRFAAPVFRPVRAALFVTLGCFGLIPGLHSILAWGWTQALVEMQLVYIVAGGAAYILGAVLYGARVPERFLPGSCDLLGQSHQVRHTWHFCTT